MPENRFGQMSAGGTNIGHMAKTKIGRGTNIDMWERG